MMMPTLMCCKSKTIRLDGMMELGSAQEVICVFGLSTITSHIPQHNDKTLNIHQPKRDTKCDEHTERAEIPK